MEARSGAVEGLPDRPGSLNQLKKLGDAIRDEDAVAYGDLHYNEVWSWSNDLVAAAVRDIVDLDLGSVLNERVTVAVTGRAKIRDTVREKLQRRRNDKLPSIQDLAGVRVEADMTLTEQNRVVDAIRRRFGQGVDSVHDLRDGSHSGYRAVHLWVRLDSPRGGWFEVQVRTRLQGDWANMYEALADAFGRGIRYGELANSAVEREIVARTQRISSEHLVALEVARDLRDQARRAGLQVDEGMIANLFQQMGVSMERSVRVAKNAVAPDDQTVDAILKKAVALFSSNLTDLTDAVRSLSQGKGE